MQRAAMKFNWLSCGLALLFCVAASGIVSAQDATPPPPPADTTQPSLQQAPPEANVRAVRLSDVQGSVQIFSGASLAFTQAQVNMPVVEGMKLVTATDGRAEIQFEDGSVARVTPNSSVTLEQLNSNPDGSTITTIRANSGLTYYELNGRAGQYVVKFGPDSIIPIDSSIFRLDLDHPAAELAVMHGSVHVSDDQNLAADVHTNQSIQFDPDNAAEYQLLQSVQANSWDQWNSDRDQALAELDDSATTARASSSQPDNPAWSDLDANGDWYDVPGYGEGWAPAGVGEDWDPYGAGSWGYYGGIGYTWISAYSWGWWPYHCGAWSWFGGFGWMWFPGNCGWGGVGIGFGWYPYGRIWHVPPGYRVPLRPSPVHNVPQPLHRSGPSQPLIAVNRGPQFTQQYRSVGGAAAFAGGPASGATQRTFQYQGQEIAPLQPVVRARQGGPMGEGFTSRVERMNPGNNVRPAYGFQYTPSGTGEHPEYHSVSPASRPAPSAASHPAAPAPAYHAPPPAPAPAAHPHR